VDGESNHFDICKVRIGSNLYKASEELLKKVMNTGPQRIAEAGQPCKYCVEFVLVFR
jgi:hypothetical protein